MFVKTRITKKERVIGKLLFYYNKYRRIVTVVHCKLRNETRFGSRFMKYKGHMINNFEETLTSSMTVKDFIMSVTSFTLIPDDGFRGSRLRSYMTSVLE